MLFRYDTVRLGPPKRLDDGRLIVQATLTRTGVFVYRNPDGTERREYRAPDVVSRADSLEGLKLAPVTNTHPPTMLNAENARQYTVGQVGQDVRMDGSHVVATLVINDGATVREIESRSKREVSCGYACDLDETPGVSPDGERYDARQINVQYNHLAVVEAGRAGSARIRIDGADALFEVPAGDTASPRTDNTRADVRSPVDELQKALAKITELTLERDNLAKRADASDAKAKELEIKLTQAESDKAAEAKRADAEKTRADAADKARTDAAERFDAQVRELATLQAEAVEFLGRSDKGEVLSADGKATIDVAKMDARAIRVAVVEKLDGTKIDEKRSADAVALAYELATGRAKAARASHQDARATIVIARSDASNTGDAEAKARAASTQRVSNAWKDSN